MTTKTLLPSSSHITDRYFFRAHSNDTRLSTKNKLDNTPPSQRKRYKFSSINTEQYASIYKFPTDQNEKRSHSSDSNRYYFSSDDLIQKPQQTLTYLRSGSSSDQRSVTFIEGSSTFLSDTPYLFSKTITTTTSPQKYSSTTSTSIHPESKIILIEKLYV
jgi:hypothetical protein